MTSAIPSDRGLTTEVHRRAAAGRLPVINGLRGLAIVGVLSFHIIEGMFTENGFPSLAAPLISGWTGVNLFFILSGFVLFLPCAADDAAIAGLAHPGDFYRRRCRRLLPLFWIGTLASWALGIAEGQSSTPSQLLSVLSGSFILDARSFTPSFNPALWSLGDEIAFSLLFPYLAASMRRHGAGRVLALTLTGAVALRLGGIWRFPALQGATFNSDMFACRIDEFVLGMALARGFAIGWLPRRPLLCTATGATLLLAAWAGFDLVLRGRLPPLCRAGLNDVLDAGFALIVIAALTPATRLSAVLSWPPLQVVGMMCYSLYIWHMPLLDWIAPHRAQMALPQLAGALAACLAATLAVAALSYRFIEFPHTGDWRRLFLLSPPLES